MKERQQPEGQSLSLRTLDPAFVEELRIKQSEALVSRARLKLANDAWMEKLSKGDYSGPSLDRSQYLALRNTVIEGNPRQTEEYRRLCREAVGVGEKPDMDRYLHLKEADLDVIRWVVCLEDPVVCGYQIRHVQP